MQKNLKISVLLDFYADMLTEKQREAVELYYNEDLSLSEIAEHTGITRQGVRDSIKRAESILLELEDRLGHAGRFRRIQSGLDDIVQNAKDVQFLCDSYNLPNEALLKLRQIAQVASGLND